MIGIFMFILCI